MPTMREAGTTTTRAIWSASMNREAAVKDHAGVGALVDFQTGLLPSTTR